MKKNILEKLALILSVILFLVPKYIAPVCGPRKMVLIWLVILVEML